MLSSFMIKVPARRRDLHIKRKNASKINEFIFTQSYKDRHLAMQYRRLYP